MKSHSNRELGMTLIEAMLYSMLLSFLLSGFFLVVYEEQVRNIDFLDDVQAAQEEE